MPRGSDMERLLQNLRTAPDRVMDAATTATVKALKKSVDSGYEQRRDVNGKRYIPAKDGHMPQMERTGTLRNGYDYQTGENGNDRVIRVSTNTDAETGRPYDEYLRDGTPKMAAHKHIPRPGDPMPTAWDARVKTAQAAAIRRLT